MKRHHHDTNFKKTFIQMSPMIKACADRLITKLETIATKEGKFNAKT